MPAGGNVVYAVIPDCQLQSATVSAADAITTVLSHELVEAATNPYIETAPAWYGVAAPFLIWELATGGLELADLCEYPITQPVGGAGHFAIQRSYSNAAALAGNDPCVPARGVYFNAAVVTTDDVLISPPHATNMTLATRGSYIAAGATRQLQLRLFSNAAVTWQLSVEQLCINECANLAFILEAPLGRNGRTLNLTVTVLREDATLGFEAFVVTSTFNGVRNYWYGVVSQRLA